MKMSMRVVQSLNVLWVYAIFIILFLTFAYEFYFLDEACSLCLLQRNLLMLCSIGFILNLKFGVKLAHYLLSFFTALCGAGIAFYEHVEFFASDLPYLSGFWGIPLYCWSLLVFTIMIIFLFVIMLARPADGEHGKKKLSILILIPIIGIALFSLLNFLYYN